MNATKPNGFIGFGAMDVTKPYKFIDFGSKGECTLCYAIVLPAGDRASGMDFVLILIGRASKSDLRPAKGQPEDRV